MIEPDFKCKTCVMPDHIPDIDYVFGECNYCRNLEERRKNKTIFEVTNFDDTIAQIKVDGLGLEYDCVVGVSGGVDSSYVLHLAVEAGLRPLAVHMDNGWNSELAQTNVARLIKKLDVDLYTHVIEWEVYKSMLQAFLDADVVDVELLYDNAMLAVNYNLASRFGIKWILGGMNSASEGIKMPSSWNWFKFDTLNIKNILKSYNCTNTHSFPFIGLFELILYSKFKKIKWISILDTVPYNKERATQLLEKNYQYKRYPYKHYESVLTRFYQAEILPKKFNIDKRQVHLSSLIKSGQISRSEALAVLATDPYPNDLDRVKDKRYFLKKMEWSAEDLDIYLSRKPVPHENFYTYTKYTKFIKKFEKFFR